MQKITIAIESPDQPEVIALLEASDAYAAALYPAESNHMASIDSLMTPDVTFLVARLDGKICGCVGLFCKGQDWGEIKRMYVDDAARGLSLGKQLLSALEDQARDAKLDWVRLETGIHQPQAIGLYHRAGYVDIPPFGDYLPDPVSVFMEKRLS
ncbi:MAG: GNAT family N-acetyltransferase [Alphaproteobacteria bacterium]|jgi:putative acetyltransferase|nr:GNAT family N-acetyltransferase [Alphaproteobacteria bacterium]MBT4017484.1 GNAT family N-acetyltransferase [Alphaproteobacteria bacterium]MBT4967024.1 GNAT family N-acetyltransferase [Alphaproteobacteria bacterium]MBT5161858.1 GNAT family N-acetyltransferase [Alphaproteobacteria bacterium]MBT5920010.1 GNAT family N-acetyltransferase [Alphaproteobacteria bacterium]